MCDKLEISSIGNFDEDDFATIVDGTLVIHRINGKDKSIRIKDDEADFVLDALIRFIERDREDD